VYHLFAAAAVHGIEADVAMRRNLGEQARLHGFPVAIELAFDLGFPLIGMRLNALVGELFVNLQRGIVKP
jgi:hypothetical protein